MARAKKDKLHIGFPREWKRWLVQRVKVLQANVPEGSNEKHTQETEILKALRMYRDLLEGSGRVEILPRTLSPQALVSPPS
jgi:hypothetical protein